MELPKPIIVRVDDVGRAEALAYDTVEAQADPLDPTTKYFLNRFIDDYYSRRGATVEQAWPRALRFLTTTLANEAFRLEVRLPRSRGQVKAFGSCHGVYIININSCGRCGPREQRGIQRTCGRL